MLWGALGCFGVLWGALGFFGGALGCFGVLWGAFGMPPYHLEGLPDIFVAVGIFLCVNTTNKIVIAIFNSSISITPYLAYSSYSAYSVYSVEPVWQVYSTFSAYSAYCCQPRIGAPEALRFAPDGLNGVNGTSGQMEYTGQL